MLQWQSSTVTIPGYHTKNPSFSIIEIQLNASNLSSRTPYSQKHITYQPQKDFNVHRSGIYGDWVTNDSAWDQQVHTPLSLCQRNHLKHPQVHLPPCATLLGVNLSSDKMKISTMTGDHITHPLLIIIANIDSPLWLSTSSHAFPLLALLPMPKFIGVRKGLHGILENRLTHSCLNFITYLLKVMS